MEIWKPIGSQILPHGIHTHNQLHLLDSSLALQLLFTRCRGVLIFELFPVHQPVKFVSAGKASEPTCLVLEDTLANIASDADVEAL